MSRNVSAVKARRRIEVLAITTSSDDCGRLRSIMSHTNWAFHCVSKVSAALDFLRGHVLPVVLCAASPGDTTWKELVLAIKELPNPPKVIVYAEEGNGKMWAEILAGGVHDVLTKPLEAADLYEAVSLAWRSWCDQSRRSDAVMAQN